MLLDDAHRTFGWPSRDQILHPAGSGARVFADFAERKIRAELERKYPRSSVHVGVLAVDPNSESTEPPIAVVCEFPTGASNDELEEAHRLAWNFSRTALLITLEPHRLIVWSCYQHPKKSLAQRKVHELDSKQFATSPSSQQPSLLALLHWVSLITGSVLRQTPSKFPMEGRADKLLLKNLRFIRRQLLNSNPSLPRHYCHDLLARMIFTQFLFDRKDSDGRPFIDRKLLEGRFEGKLTQVHTGLETILRDKEETYALFGWLDDKFNGDLFPGKDGQSTDDREKAWQDEKDAVTPDHLKLLADFVSGKLDQRNQQLLLWRYYSFDTIPLEFISSVYEEFLNEDRERGKAYYTPTHLVDFVLDGVLPWNGTEWNLKILDPACGSGIFLVKAFQRLIYRWKQAHPDKEPHVSDLKPLLAQNLCGVDINGEAVRVACFSLYLAMADAIEPKYYLKRGKVFPHIRGTRLIAKDFFDDAITGIRSVEDASVYDLVVGNAPWGDGSIKQTSDQIPPEEIDPATAEEKAPFTRAEEWAGTHHWPVSNFDIGPLFLAKAALLVKADGHVAMIQPASPLLYLRSGSAAKLRAKLFTDFTVDEVINLSGIRRELFPDVVGPACVIIMGSQKPTPATTLHYIYPKPSGDRQGRTRITIASHDVNQLTHHEAANEPDVWPALAFGGRRDLDLIRRLRSAPTLKKYKKKGLVDTREGVIRGNKARFEPDIVGKRVMDGGDFPVGMFLQIDASQLPKETSGMVHDRDSTNFDAFKLPQLIIKQTLQVEHQRFQAALVKGDEPEWGIICSQSFISVHEAGNGNILKSAWLSLTSQLSVYYISITSSRLGHYRPEPLVKELLSVPLVDPQPRMLDGIKSAIDVDRRVRELFHLYEADWVLIEDLLRFGLPNQQTEGSESYSPTSRTWAKASRQFNIEQYAAYFCRVVKATFGNDKAVCATVFEESDDQPLLPVRMIAIHLDWPGHETVKVEKFEADGLVKTLDGFYGTCLKPQKDGSGIDGLFFQRVAFLFHNHEESDRRVHSLYIIKPDECRYWTRSLAMRDADQLSSSILQAASQRSTEL
ncbi:N-6 DNA Methylase [Singulisphaera sp. GP187]|uniref:HsdM family class I SAM-dependent methyltransferase n=1 Tax=Singulisphaera sp. GP187 TaxID=1882752 RepID=UPI00092A7543|nr:N-6 DNA methylase [Singulisphaera sp. GP187]SIN83670.1 N-6 DNA Methylase [Singulisphaera sp. GP187]